MSGENCTLQLVAEINRLPDVKAFIDEKLDAVGCSKKTKMNINLCVEEIYTNVCSYAYAPNTGDVTIEAWFNENKDIIYIKFVDMGVPYNPLSREDPDIEAKAEDRLIGGLGIFMTKKLMDNMSYEYVDNSNVLTLEKNLK